MNTQHQDSVQHLHGDVAGRARRRRAVNGRFHTCRLTTTSDELGPKTKVDEVETAEPLEATPASPEDGIRVKRVPTKVTYWRVVQLYILDHLRRNDRKEPMIVLPQVVFMYSH